jgi:hypothetical protein
VSLAITGSVPGRCSELTCLCKRILRPSAHLAGRGLFTVPEKSLPSTFMVTFVAARDPALLGNANPPRATMAARTNRSLEVDAHLICDVETRPDDATGPASPAEGGSRRGAER